jgi:hypothetical protein
MTRDKELVKLNLSQVYPRSPAPYNAHPSMAR